MAKQQAQSDQSTNQATQSNPDAQQTPVGDVHSVTPATAPDETPGTPSDEELEQLEKVATVPDAETDPEGFAQYLKEKAKKKSEALIADRLAQVPEQEEEPTGSLDV